MPAPRKPTAVLSLAGRFKKDPKRGRARANEPVDNAPLGDPPEYFQPTERQIWNEIQHQLVDGVALASDRHAFEMLVRLVGLMRTNGIGSLEGAQLTQMTKLFTLFGMTPADRSRVSAPPGGRRRANAFTKLG